MEQLQDKHFDEARREPLQLANGDHRRVVTNNVPDLQHRAASPGRFGNSARLRDIRRQWFLDQAGDYVFEQAFSGVAMMNGRRGDCDRVHASASRLVRSVPRIA